MEGKRWGHLPAESKDSLLGLWVGQTWPKDLGENGGHPFLLPPPFLSLPLLSHYPKDLHTLLGSLRLLPRSTLSLQTTLYKASLARSELSSIKWDKKGGGRAHCIFLKVV